MAYALSQVEIVSFFPLDIAQAGIRLTPGAIATQGIEALGPAAKLLAEASALVLVLLVGAAAGGVVLGGLLYYARPCLIRINLSGRAASAQRRRPRSQLSR